MNIESKPNQIKLDEFVGIEDIVVKLHQNINLAKNKEVPLENLLLCGPSGVGKSALAKAIVFDMGNKCTSIKGKLSEGNDIIGIITSLESNEILFIEDIDQLSSRRALNWLKEAVIEHTISLKICDDGVDELRQTKKSNPLFKPTFHIAKLVVEPFTLIGTTSTIKPVTSQLKSLFHTIISLDYYADDIIYKFRSICGQ